MKHPESQRVKQLRGKETLREFAEKFDTSGSNIQVIEADKQGLAVQLAKKIAIYYKVSMDWLYGISDEGGPKSMRNVNEEIKVGVENNISAPIDDLASLRNNTHEMFYKKIIEEKDKQISMLSSFLKSREEDLSDCRGQVAHLRSLYERKSES